MKIRRKNLKTKLTRRSLKKRKNYSKRLSNKLKLNPSKRRNKKSKRQKYQETGILIKVNLHNLQINNFKLKNFRKEFQVLELWNLSKWKKSLKTSMKFYSKRRKKELMH